MTFVYYLADQDYTLLAGFTSRELALEAWGRKPCPENLFLTTVNPRKPHGKWIYAMETWAEAHAEGASC